MSWLDHLPAHERERIREKYKMSAAAYEKLREKVKGPEDLAQEMIWNERMAQLKFGMDSEPALKQALKKQIERDIAEQGVEAVLENFDLSSDMKTAIEHGKFTIAVDSPMNHTNDQLVVCPEGNVAEKIPVNLSLTQTYVTQLRASI